MNAITRFIKESLENAGRSATCYRPVDLSSQDFAPSAPFKGIHVSGAGNIVIVGLDGKPATIAVTPGCYPFGGLQITKTNTTATGITALF